MIISGKILHLNAITHDGKVVFFGVDPDGVIWYSVKRSGFEDTSLTDASDPFGFDAWKQLILGVSVADPSVAADELANLTDGQGKHLVRSCFDDGTWVHELVKTVQAPVQLVSAFGYIYVFRQAFTNRQILVSRFVLDGMKNELVPRLEVRFRRSKQRFKAEAPALMYTGLVAGSALYQLSPVLTVGKPLPALLLSQELREQHAQKITSTSNYPLRQSIFLVKMVAGMCWGQDEQVRKKMNLGAYEGDPGTWRSE